MRSIELKREVNELLVQAGSHRATPALNQMTGDIQMFDLAKFRFAPDNQPLAAVFALSGLASSSINNQIGWRNACSHDSHLGARWLLGRWCGDSHQQKQSTLDAAAVAARAYINKDLGFRKWATSHGGVYVPPHEHTPPIPISRCPTAMWSPPRAKR